MALNLLDEASYLQYLEPPSEQGVCDCTHIAKLRVEGKEVRAYVKAFSDLIPSTGRANRSLPNEVIGYLFAEYFGLPVPQTAGLVALEAKHLPERPPWLHHDAVVPAWWTGEIGGKSLRAHIIHGRLPHSALAPSLSILRTEMLACATVPSIIAFDEWIANEDRHPGNLMRLGIGNYCLIDHGHVLTGCQWVATDLKPGLQPKSALMNFLGAEVRKLPFGHAIQAAFEAQSEKFEQALTAASQWLDDLLDAPDRKSVEHFLRARAAPATGAQRRGLMI